MDDKGDARESRRFATGRLAARPRRVESAGPSGLHRLQIEGGRDGFVYAPKDAGHRWPAPLVLLLHGAGGDARDTVNLLESPADRHGLILLVPDSRDYTWDIIRGGYGPDVAYIERALEQTFGRYEVDPSYVAAAGFSDGASYALSLGATNGDLFTHVLAFSPGFMAPAAPHGSPKLFISHGTRDRVLPVDVCSRRIVPRVREAGYEVLYVEFEGPHTVPPAIAAEAVEWFLKD
ncbi:MAG: phospholipase [Acidobacteria bacterium]|nr:phospholipase [Acidobacteriota bacterium]